MQNIRSNALSTNTRFGSTLFTDDTLYKVQEWNIPGIQIEHPIINSRAGNMFVQSERVEYNPLNLRLIVDEELLLCREILKIVQTYHIPRTNTSKPIKGDSWVEIYDSKNHYLFKIVFSDCYIKQVEDLDYKTTDDNNTISLGIEIGYDYYTIE